MSFLHYVRAQGVPPEVLKLPVLETPPNPGPADPTTREAITAVAGLPESLARQVIRVTATSPVDIEFILTGNRRVVWGDSDRGSGEGANPHVPVEPRRQDVQRLES